MMTMLRLIFQAQWRKKRSLKNCADSPIRQKIFEIYWNDGRACAITSQAAQAK